MPNVPLCQEGDVSCLYAMHLVGADDFAQLFATKERYRCGMPLAGTVRPFCAPILFFLFSEKEKNRRAR